jgi:hypothetical protein
MGLRFTFHLGQIKSGSNLGLFSKLQVCIFKVCIDGSSYTSIRKIFQIYHNEAQFLDSPGIEPAKATDQRIYPASVKCNFKRLYPSNLVLKFND